MKRISNQIIYFAATALKELGYDFDAKNNPQIKNMQKTVDSLKSKSIEIKVEFYPDGSWSAESVNIDGIMTGGNNPQKIHAMVQDAILTYFEIPPHLCSEKLLRSDNEPVYTSHLVHVTA